MPFIYGIDLVINNSNYFQKWNSLKPKIKIECEDIHVTVREGP
jgi:hypothetical protein